MTAMKKALILAALVACVPSIFPAARLLSQPLGPAGPIPARRQLDRQEQEFFIFVHFGPNTFTGNEWGKGTEPESLFNPTALDASRWCRIAKAAGAKGIIITAKHHDGFCLWPSRYSAHTVRESPWRGGKGDVLRDLSDACRASGLKFGVYISPWDRNHPAYGTPAYNDVFVNTMKEIFDAYGPVYELWWDGANGEGPGGRRQEYDFRRYENTIREISPSTVIFSDIGPDLRWVGNEDGIAGESNWNLLDTAGFGRGATGPPPDTLNRGNENGALWIPAECDVSIRPGWFYHAAEDSLVKSPRDLMRLYLMSVGRGSTLLLNVPPGPDGLFAPGDSASLAGFRKLVDEFYRADLAAGASASSTDPRDGSSASSLTDGDPLTYWAAKDPPASDGQTVAGTPAAPSVEVDLGAEKTFNTVLLREYLTLGQRVSRFGVEALTPAGWREVASGTTMGRKRILQFPQTTASKIRIVVRGAKAAPALSSIELYNVPDYLNDK
jgi:alpha-L-fucosidase